MRLSGVISIRRLLRRSAITIGYGNGLPHEATGFLRLPVTGGIGGSATPLDTMPAPIISAVTCTATPFGAALEAAPAASDAGPQIMSSTAMPIRLPTSPRLAGAKHLPLCRIGCTSRCAFINGGLVYHEWTSRRHDLAQNTSLPWANRTPRCTRHIFRLRLNLYRLSFTTRPCSGCTGRELIGNSLLYRASCSADSSSGCFSTIQ